MSRHPAVDVITARSAVVVQNRALVPMSSWLIDAMARCAESGLSLQVLTPHDGRITLPLRMALGGSKMRWVVREPGDGHYEGFTGLPLDWDGMEFVPAERARTDGPSSTFLHGTGDEAGAVLGHHVIVDLRVVHDATAELELGAAVEGLAKALAGAAPVCWGTAEPALSRWDRAAITALCRRRTPRATWLVFTGGHGGTGPAFAGTVRVARVDSGVKEEITFVMSRPGGTLSPDTLDTLAELAGQHASTTALSTLTAYWAPGRADLTHPARRLGHPTPVAMAIGPSGIAETGTRRVLSAPVRAQLIGDPAEPGAWYRLTDGAPDTAWPTLRELIRHLTSPVRAGADARGRDDRLTPGTVLDNRIWRQDGRRSPAWTRREDG
ncbi:hypothetical protein E1293_10880 [Actinomadura darangshiensis]|uniref:Uncharacterized protein n=1 Tax=Actinomadura darangshiensis TaxID=705336 RepID=A0A4R5BNP9_9ACTN|nr:DUF6177 family protein [Actinomadura darangshiensis]TDD85602.1 hypothetical protein E1293_10880 [Actinomadura darangshiensis]